MVLKKSPGEEGWPKYGQQEVQREDAKNIKKTGCASSSRKG